MDTLRFPDPRADLRMTIAPPRGQGRSIKEGLPFLGQLTLATDKAGATSVQVTLDTGAQGAAAVSYSSDRSRIGEIAAFALTISKPGEPDQQWVFGGMTLVHVRFRLKSYSASLTIDGVEYVLSGVSGPVETGFGLWLTVREGGETIGSLRLPPLGKEGGMFIPSGGGRPIPVVPMPGGIQWVFKSRTYMGFPAIFDLATAPDSATIEGGYGGFSVREKHDDSDWEASARGPVLAAAIESAPVETARFPFPWSQFRLLVSPTPSDTVSVSSGVQHWGTIAFAQTNGQPTVTLESSSGSFTTVAVSYGSTRPDYGSVGPFKAEVDGSEWEFGGLTIFRWQGETFVVSYSLTIGGEEYNLTALPMPAKPFSGVFAVSQGGSVIGTLTMRGTRASYFVATGSSAKQVVSVRDESISWGGPPEVYSGFPFFLDVQLSRRGVTPVVGFLGSTEVILEDEEDWEASARGPEPLPRTSCS